MATSLKALAGVAKTAARVLPKGGLKFGKKKKHRRSLKSRIKREIQKQALMKAKMGRIDRTVWIGLNY